MVIVIRKGVRVDKGVSLGEFRREQTRKRIARRGATKSEIKSPTFRAKFGIGESGELLPDKPNIFVAKEIEVVKVKPLEINKLKVKSDVREAPKRITIEDVNRALMAVRKASLSDKKARLDKLERTIKKTRSTVVAKALELPSKYRKVETKISDFLRLPVVQSKLEKVVESRKPKIEKLPRLEEEISKIKAKRSRDPIRRVVDSVNLFILKGSKKRIVSGKPSFSQEVILDITRDITKNPVKNTAFFLAGAGLGKGANLVSGKLGVLAKSSPRLASKLRVGSRVVSTGVIGAYGAGVVSQGAKELSERGTLSGTTANVLREFALFGGGVALGARPSIKQKADIKAFNKFVNQLNVKDRKAFTKFVQKTDDQLLIGKAFDDIRKGRVTMKSYQDLLIARSRNPSNFKSFDKRLTKSFSLLLKDKKAQFRYRPKKRTKAEIARIKKELAEALRNIKVEQVKANIKVKKVVKPKIVKKIKDKVTGKVTNVVRIGKDFFVERDVGQNVVQIQLVKLGPLRIKQLKLIKSKVKKPKVKVIGKVKQRTKQVAVVFQRALTAGKQVRNGKRGGVVGVAGISLVRFPSLKVKKPVFDIVRKKGVKPRSVPKPLPFIKLPKPISKLIKKPVSRPIRKPVTGDKSKPVSKTPPRIKPPKKHLKKHPSKKPPSKKPPGTHRVPRISRIKRPRVPKIPKIRFKIPKIKKKIIRKGMIEKQIVFFTPTLTGDPKKRKIKVGDEEIQEFFTGLEIRP